MCVSIPAGLVAAAMLCAVLNPDDWNWVKNLQYAVFITVVTVLMVVIATRKLLLLAGRVSAIVCGFAAVGLFNQFGLFGKLTYHYPVAALLVFAGALGEGGTTHSGSSSPF